ncbi:G-protein coupled receptor AH9.1 [Biomphalaria glabrata]|uniref:Probable G-protein coupled receptor AH9.1 n=1 Tax=Biomphalaria glabrata TaxID=6526 RepID=A0A9U8EA98_BIOGL|nr:probable G-protein coupled receptor AH9.1 [Biomphalaria glabrata]KAI8731535.1 putative G-protein coupled receptor AH9.1 [Biomphalaria glabrata]
MNNSEEYLSDSTKKIFFLINHVIIGMTICVFGIVGNCLNIAVFLKQGLRVSINLSLFAMSLSDLIGLIFQVWHKFCLNPYLELADLPIDFLSVQILTAGSPNIAMSRITCWITMYITAERCLSVLLPLRIRNIVTFKRTAVILLFCYSINLAFYFPVYSSSSLDWSFDPNVNRTLFTIVDNNRTMMVSLLMNVSHFYLSVIAFICNVIFTAILVVSLKKKSDWRRSATFVGDQNEALTRRDKKTVTMVITVAAILIVCYSPGVTSCFVEIFVPDFSIFAKQRNVYQVIWSFCFLFHSVNASINVIVYYRISSKYRTTFNKILFG